VHDEDDRLTQDFDDGLPGCGDDQVLETDYLANGWVSREAIRKRPATREQSGWPTRQVTTSAYFRNGDLEKQETFTGVETDPSNLVESHTLTYVSEQGVYMNGHRLTDVYKLVGPGGSGPCATSACTATYGYDARERLVSWANGLPSGQGQTSIAYEVDEDDSTVGDTLAGNVTREAVTVNGQAQPVKDYVYTPAGQLVSMSVGGTLSERYFYERGNLRCVTGPAASDCSGTTLEKYKWDPLDRLEKFETTGPRGTKADVVDYVYDAFDRPVESTETRGGQPQTSTLEYLGLTDAVSNETRGSVSNRYSYDANLTRTGLSISGGNNSGNYTYGRNAHGDVSLLLQETGGAKAAYGYRPYGDKDTGLFAGDGDDSDPTNPYRFNDRRLDTGSGSIDMGARRFAPDTGRFLQQDFYREALDDLELSEDSLTQNRYAFAGGNPISFIETDGHRFDRTTGARTRSRARNRREPSLARRLDPRNADPAGRLESAADFGESLAQVRPRSVRRAAAKSARALRRAGHISAQHQNPHIERYKRARAQTTIARARASTERWRTAGRVLGYGGVGLGAVGAIQEQRNIDRGDPNLTQTERVVRAGIKTAGSVGGAVAGGAIGTAACSPAAVTIVGAVITAGCGATGAYVGQALGSYAADRLNRTLYRVDVADLRFW
jgi:RHS repeat-associated protein